MSGTIRQNLSYGISEPVEDAQMLNALQQAQLMDWFELLPDGLETQIREAGANLSGGQRQRFAIARAVLRDAEILLLDEVTSSMDVETENQLQLALNSVTQGRTVIVAAHRLYTVVQADQIIMLDQGRLLGVGKHEELMRILPEYQALVETQLLSIQCLRSDI